MRTASCFAEEDVVSVGVEGRWWRVAVYRVGGEACWGEEVAKAVGRERREREKVSGRRGGRRCIFVLGATWWSNGGGELEIGASRSWRWLDLGRFSRDILQLAGSLQAHTW